MWGYQILMWMELLLTSGTIDVAGLTVDVGGPSLDGGTDSFCGGLTIDVGDQLFMRGD